MTLIHFKSSHLIESQIPCYNVQSCKSCHLRKKEGQLALEDFISNVFIDVVPGSIVGLWRHAVHNCIPCYSFWYSRIPRCPWIFCDHFMARITSLIGQVASLKVSISLSYGHYSNVFSSWIHFCIQTVFFFLIGLVYFKVFVQNLYL